jgi:murein endopeptidase
MPPCWIPAPPSRGPDAVRGRAALIAAAATGALALGGCAADDAGEPQRLVRPLQIAPPPPPVEKLPQPAPQPAGPSRAIGSPVNGRLVNGVLLGDTGPDWVTWDPILKRSPNRPWRRYGTQELVDKIERVLRRYRRLNPDAPPVLVGDLSRPTGGVFDRRYGGLGHASHQNGLDVDIYYPRKDRRLLAPARADQVDMRLAQSLLDRFLVDGVQFAFVGYKVRLKGPRRKVQAIPHHDDHLHVRIAAPRR